MEKVIPFKKLSLENAVYWKTLIEFIQITDSYEDRIEEVVCDLSSFCKYVEWFVTCTDLCNKLELWAVLCQYLNLAIVF